MPFRDQSFLHAAKLFTWTEDVLAIKGAQHEYANIIGGYGCNQRGNNAGFVKGKRSNTAKTCPTSLRLDALWNAAFIADKCEFVIGPYQCSKACTIKPFRNT